MKMNLPILKKYLLTATVVTALFACNRAELERANHENDSLKMLLGERESTIEERDSTVSYFLSSFNEIQRNLDSVSARQHLIFINSDKQMESKPGTKGRISSQIASINDLLDQNKVKIAALNKKLKGLKVRNVELEKAIVELNVQLTQKNKELEDLNGKLSLMNLEVGQLKTSVDTLTAQNNSRRSTIDAQTAALHTAYWVVGQSYDLEKDKLIERKGGILGIRKTSTMNQDVDNSKFTRIDYTQVSSIPVNAKSAKLVTPHPSDSYRLDMDKKFMKNIVITNADKFWSASKYLVVVIE